MAVIPRNNRPQYFDRLGNFGAIFLEPDVVQVEVEDVPVARVVSVRADFVLGHQVLLALTVCIGR